VVERTLEKGSQRKDLTRGIYLVANRQSADECRNLIYSIRECGSVLPIRVILFGGESLHADLDWVNVELMQMADFPAEGLAFVEELHRRIPQCPLGFLRRFLCWFGEFEEFLYSDNDIVALMNWDELFTHLNDYELVHADKEYLTGGVFNFRQPRRFEELMGPGSLQEAVTAGHFLCRPKPQHRKDLLDGLAWMEAHPEVPLWHDQTLMHVTLALAKWPVLNLCKPPHNWASSFAGEYANVLDVCRTIQVQRRPLSHLHFSGGIAKGTMPIDEFLLVSLSAKERNRKLLPKLSMEASGLSIIYQFFRRAGRKAKRIVQGST
jgi:hypothetical protein